VVTDLGDCRRDLGELRRQRDRRPQVLAPRRERQRVHLLAMARFRTRWPYRVVHMVAVEVHVAAPGCPRSRCLGLAMALRHGVETDWAENILVSASSVCASGSRFLSAHARRCGDRLVSFRIGGSGRAHHASPRSPDEAKRNPGAVPFTRSTRIRCAPCGLPCASLQRVKGAGRARSAAVLPERREHDHRRMRRRRPRRPSRHNARCDRGELVSGHRGRSPRHRGQRVEEH